MKLLRDYILTSRLCHNWFWPLRDLKYGVQNLFVFFKVIFTWRWWDYHFLLRLLIFVLKRMEKQFTKYGCHLYVDRDVKNMKIVRLLLERVLKDNYHSNVYKNHDKKWGKMSISWDDLDDGMSEMIFSRPNAITEEEIIQQDKEYARLIRKPDQLKKQDLDYAFKLMSKHLLSWWD